MVFMKRGSPTCEIQIEDAKIEQVQKCNYLSVLTEDGKYNTEI